MSKIKSTFESVATECDGNRTGKNIGHKPGGPIMVRDSDYL